MAEAIDIRQHCRGDDLKLLACPQGLAGLWLLQTTSPEVVRELVERCDLRRLSAGEVLITRGAPPGGAACILVRGELEVWLEVDDEAPVAFLRPGDIVGEVSLLDNAPPSATVRAATTSTVLVVNEAEFWWLVSVSHGFAAALLIKLAERLRSSNGAARANLELRKHFEHAALYDVLTGVHSRRWLEDMLPRVIERHKRGGQPVTIALLDLDHFKRINDQHGHAMGDAVLRSVGRLLQQRLRPTDLVARFGGEEFVVVLAGTGLEGAFPAMERLHAALRSGFPELEAQGLGPVTMSIGLCEAAEELDAEGILRRADHALYEAKHNGRNQTRAARTSSSTGAASDV